MSLAVSYFTACSCYQCHGVSLICLLITRLCVCGWSNITRDGQCSLASLTDIKHNINVSAINKFFQNLLQVVKQFRFFSQYSNAPILDSVDLRIISAFFDFGPTFQSPFLYLVICNTFRVVCSMLLSCNNSRKYKAWLKTIFSKLGYNGVPGATTCCRRNFSRKS